MTGSWNAARVRRRLVESVPMPVRRWMRSQASYDVALRLRTASERVGQQGTAVLDVGGGGNSIAALLPHRRVVQLDIDRDGLSGPLAVQADGRALPFGDGTFAAAVSIHSLEHVPHELRPLVLSEMKRVARHVVIVVPAGTHARWVSERFIAALCRLRRPVPRYAQEHLDRGIPELELMAETLSDGHLEVAWRRNRYVELINILVSHIPVVRFGAATLYRLVLRWFDNAPPFCEVVLDYHRTEVGRLLTPLDKQNDQPKD